MKEATFYHIYNHENGNENLFREEDNYQFFLKKWAAYISVIADTYAYCLMPNHFHFLLRIKEEKESKVTFQGKLFKEDTKHLTGFQNLSGLSVVH